MTTRHRTKRFTFDLNRINIIMLNKYSNYMQNNRFLFTTTIIQLRCLKADPVIDEKQIQKKKEGTKTGRDSN